MNQIIVQSEYLVALREAFLKKDLDCSIFTTNKRMSPTHSFENSDGSVGQIKKLFL